MIIKDNTKYKTGFIYDESYFWHNAGNGALFEPSDYYIEENGSVESPQSKRRVKNLLEKSKLYQSLQIIQPYQASIQQLMYYHTKTHIDRVIEYSKIGGIDCGDSAIVGKGSYEIASLSVGGGLVAVDAVMKDQIQNAYVLNRPPGHHAMADEGMGFCIFNNVVIATKYAQEVYGLKKIAIIDWDAHHGNGTEDAFYNDDSVLFISIHQDNLEPIGRGSTKDKGKDKGLGYTINIPLPVGSGDAVYENAFDEIVAPIIDNFQPELIFVSAGQDASIFDPLARMMVSADGYASLTNKVMALANKHCQGKLICLHEGGYSAEYVPFCTHAIIEQLSGIKTDVKDPFIYAMAGTGYDKINVYQKDWLKRLKEELL